ncbi:citrate/2-methylcitrate synthase [Planctomicrobium piriforme]|uniref:Citrate synthase n=1 Tax=Planctomicrobium piriforme TaxID=1576369 RepID=A0A1I3GYA2_9PLAN|nr:citrate/2-methylcitrate synthase [Planctomicrobium piriforme]SFI28361.1 citrate synthase/2-methylcitrate synthase [Planctomicrobium piriforme]
MAQDLYHPGLKGVIAGETEICRIDGGLQYRGYCLHDLAEEASFLEVAHLLLFEELPDEEQFADFLSVITEEQQLPPAIAQLYEQIPVHNSSLEVLRTGIGLLNLHDPQPFENLLQSGHSQTIRLLARVPLLIAAWHRIRQGLPLLEPRADLSYIANIYYVITGQVPCSLYERALEVAFITAAEHEFNPSSYVARIVGSVRGNQYSPVLAALDTFIGSAHGGGDERPLDILAAVGQPDHAEEWVSEQPADRPLPGFGHPVYRDYDPRAAIIEVECERLARACGRTDLEQLADAVERAVWQQRRLPPNIDWSLARLFTYLELDRDLFRPLFAASRLLGWSAHAVEQCESAEPIRPRARYRGAEDCEFESMRRRSD